MFKQQYEEYLRLVEQYLDDLPFEKNLICQSMNYSLLGGGKRVRPVLALACVELVGGRPEDFVREAAALELLHTYSLIHDDLPSMDNDDFRRGKLTNHKVFGEAIAILTGDGLLNLAFETMTQYTLKSSNTADDYKKHVRAMDEIGKYSGIYGMIGGQVVDLLSNDISMDEDKLLFMYKCKTAALIQASVVSGAILGGANEEEIENIRSFGLYLGLAYQIRDDILDEKEDKFINKVTYVTYNDILEARNKVDDLSKKATKILSTYENKDTKFFKTLTEDLITRSY
jgi:geranylgeranyl diphosphate synthase type II